MPKTLDELTDRIVRIAVVAQQENAMLPQLVAGLTEITKDYRKALFNAEWVSNHLWNKSPYELVFELPYARLIFDYDNGPYIVPGEIKRITVKISHIRFIEKLVSVKLLLPEGWTSDASTEVILNAKHSNVAEMEVSFVPDKFNSAYYYLPVKVQICDRLNPIVVNIPLQQKKSVDLSPVMLDEDFFDAVNRHKNKRQI